MAFIPKGALESLKKRPFKFIRVRSKRKKPFHLKKWRVLAKPKDEGGRGFKNIYLFGIVHVAKILCRIISKKEMIVEVGPYERVY